MVLKQNSWRLRRPRKMTPVPDCGEKVMSAVVALKIVALVTGATPELGAAKSSYAREGADVAINYLPAEEEDAQQVKSAD